MLKLSRQFENHTMPTCWSDNQVRLSFTSWSGPDVSDNCIHIKLHCLNFHHPIISPDCAGFKALLAGFCLDRKSGNGVGNSWMGREDTKKEEEHGKWWQWELGIERVQARTVLLYLNIWNWKPAVQAAAVLLRTPPIDGQSPANQPRPLPIYGSQFWECPPPSPTGHRPAACADPAECSHYVVISRDGRKLVTMVHVMLP